MHPWLVPTRALPLRTYDQRRSIVPPTHGGRPRLSCRVHPRATRRPHIAQCIGGNRASVQVHRGWRDTPLGFELRSRVVHSRIQNRRARTRRPRGLVRRVPRDMDPAATANGDVAAAHAAGRLALPGWEFTASG